MEISGKRVALYGRLLDHSRGLVGDRIIASGGTLERALTRRTDSLAMGRGALSLVPSGHLQRVLKRAEGQKTPVIGEDRLWRWLSDEEEAPPTLPIASAGELPPEPVVAILNAFDIIHEAAGSIRFSDVSTLAAAHRLAEDGHELSSIIRILLKSESISPVGRHRIVSTSGEAKLEWDDGVTGLDGQGLLPLPDQPNLDALFDAAMLAEAEGDLLMAAEQYALCTRMDRQDPIAPFNLGNVLVQLDRPKDALHRFGQAVSRDPQFAEGYYNRAKANETLENLGAAESDFENALALDPSYSDALFNLAQLKFEIEQYDKASALFERFLATEPSAHWRSVAQKALGLLNAKAKGDPAKS